MTSGGDGDGEGGVAYSVSAVARRLGIPVATLRSWNQRYDLGPSRRRPGSHRLYTREDVAVAARMVELVRAGAATASAARAARAVGGAAPEPGDVRSLLTVAHRLDSAELLALIEAHFAHHGVVDTWNLLCRPAFADIVERQDAGAGLIDVEHLLSWAVATALHRSVPALRAVGGVRPVVLACAGGENHTLALEVLRATLGERGVPALLLGPSVPAVALADAVAKQRWRPVVVLWSQSRRTATPESVRGAGQGAVRLLLAGPGWLGFPRPEGVAYVDSLERAVAEVCRAITVDREDRPDPRDG